MCLNQNIKLKIRKEQIMKKSILISIILIVVLATAAILIVPRLGQASGVRVSADTVEKSD